MYKVLHDAERVMTKHHNEDGSIDLKCGTIDSEETNNEIVHTMEDGEEAFRRRNEMYASWEYV